MRDNIFEKILTTQEFLEQGRQLDKRIDQPRAVKRINPITNAQYTDRPISFTEARNDEPLVLSPEERAFRENFKSSDIVEQIKGTSAPAASAPQTDDIKSRIGKHLFQKPEFTSVKVDEAGDAISGGTDKTGAALGLASKMAGGGGNATGGALSGAELGFTLGGPKGAAIGAVAGAISGGLKAKSAKKQRKREAEAQAQRNIANIAQETGRNRNVGISNIMQALQGAFTRR